MVIVVRKETTGLTRYSLKLFLSHVRKPLQFPLQIVAMPVQAVVGHLLLSEGKGHMTRQTLRLPGSTAGLAVAWQLTCHMIQEINGGLWAKRTSI